MGDKTRFVLVLVVLIVLANSTHSVSENSKYYNGVVNNATILEKISKGEPVKYDHVIVKGDLNLSQVKSLQKRFVDRTDSEKKMGLSDDLNLIISKIRINDSIIEDMANFNNTLFDNSTDFNSTIFKHDAYFIGSIFNHDADFMKSTFENAYFIGSTFNSTADFLSSTFNGIAYFDSPKFNDIADFGGSKFNDIADFGGSKFNSTADFRNSKFNNPANFRNSKFNSTTYFEGSNYKGIVNASEILEKISKGEPVKYDHVIIKGDLDLSHASLPTKSMDRTDYDIQSYGLSDDLNVVSSLIRIVDSSIEDTVNFGNISFNNLTNFARTKFKQDTNFIGSDFNHYANFFNTTFNHTDFRATKFNETALFYLANFTDTTNFESSNFNDRADFGGSKFNGNANFRFSNFNKDAYFDFTNFRGAADFNNSNFRGDALFLNATFLEPLYLNRAKYEKLYIRWGDIKKLGYDISTYQQLIENFKKIGYSSDADEAYYQFRKEQLFNQMITLRNLTQKNLTQEREFDDKLKMIATSISDNKILIQASDLVLWLAYGFGKRPAWSLIWSIGIILFFVGLWLWLLRGLNKPIDEYSYADKKDSEGYSWDKARAIISAIIKAFIFSSTVFLSGTRFFIEPPSLPKSTTTIKVFFTLERILGGFLSVLFFLALTGMVLRPM